MLRLTLCAALACAPALLPAQRFLDKLLDKTTEKVEESVTESASDKAAEESGEAVDRWLDGLFGGSGESPSGEGADPAVEGDAAPGAHPYGGADPEATNAMLQRMMGDMDRSADVPEAYRFDLVMDIELREGDDVTPISLLVSEDGGLFGFRADDGNGGTQTSVIDAERSLMAVFQDRADGTRQAMALPNMMEMAAAWGGSAESVEAEMDGYTFAATGRTKDIAGYRCREYHGEGEDSEVDFWITDELPVDWMETFRQGFGATLPTAYTAAYGGLDGAMMEAHATEKGGETTHWITTAVHAGGQTIRKSDYTFTMEGME